MKDTAGRAGHPCVNRDWFRMSKKVLSLDIEALRILANYAHWIPACHGYTREFMEKTYPGWDWNDLIPKMHRLGIIRREAAEGDVKLWQGLWLKAGITEVVATKYANRVKFTCLPVVSDETVTVRR